MCFASRTTCLLSLLTLAIGIPAIGQDDLQGFQTVELVRGKKQYVGALLAEDAENYVLLQRDGRMKVLARAGSSEPKVRSKQFSPYSVQAMQDALRDEFGKNYEVSQTEHYLVVHPKGKFQPCAVPFEDQYIRSQQYFRLRGVQTREPDFPLVAVVLNSRDEFDRFLETYQPENAQQQVVGYYSPRSNRTITYFQTGSGSQQAETFETLIHEATHQIAYNTGIHSRYSPMPRWFTEGLATMFEAKGVHNSGAFPGRQYRANKKWLESVRVSHPPGKSSGLLADLISSDELFRRDPQKAYGLAWAVTFYLAETQPEKYSLYIQRVAGKKSFQDYSSQQRLEDFIKVFGNDLDELESRVLRFIAEFK